VVVAQKGKQKSKKERQELQLPAPQPWISMRSGVIIIAITSVAMAALMAYEAIPVRGTVNGILLGLAYGVLIWIIYFGNILLNRFLRRRRR
jgi:hypothetical protein